MLKKTLVVLVAAFLLLSFSTRAEAQLCVPASTYDALAWTWQYHAPCSTTYNCLSYALGITNTWTWPWGSNNPTNNQVNAYMATKGYSTTGTYLKIASYGSGSAIKHFSKITGDSTCLAKCGSLNVLKHNSLDPYYHSGSYGAKITVYKTGNLLASISGPSKGYNNQTYTWCANVSGGTPPYTYEWFSELGGIQTTSCISEQLQDGFHLSIMLTVRDSAGLYKNVSHLVLNMDGRKRAAATPISAADKKLANCFTEMLFHLDNTASSPNPYDYTDNPGFRKIVAMGPAALQSIKKAIINSKNNGLPQYLLAIAAEEIAAVDLKSQSGKWENSAGWVYSWDLFLRDLPSKVDSIIESGHPAEEIEAKLEALGFAALPVIEDKLNEGYERIRPAFKKLLQKLNSSHKRAAHSTGETINIYRSLIKKMQH